MDWALIVKASAAVLSIAGSGLLAWRVRGLLKALTLVAEVHETNIQQIMATLVDGQSIVNFRNSTKHVEKAQGFVLLVLGFVFLGASGALQLVALFMGS